ncbi:MAG: gfo/Idh/MocA family oxidoreductase, partial [Planctomycetota bacterium]
RLGIGYIGVGTMAYNHVKGLINEKDVQIITVCDVAKDRREITQKTIDKGYSKDTTYKGCAGFNDHHELLARKDIDAVIIAAPDHWHAAIALDAMKAGKDVYCEKPLTHTIHEAKTLIEAARKLEKVFQTGSQQRSEGPFRQAVDYVRAGRLGKIKQITVGIGGTSKPCDLPEQEMQPGLDWDRWLGPAPKRGYNEVLSPRGVHTHFPNWRAYREYSGGMMTDWGAHHFDIGQWILDMDKSGPVEIIPPDDGKDRGVKYVYANGAEMIHGGPGGVTIKGELGEIFVDRGKITSTPDTILKEPLGEKDAKIPKSPGHKRNWLDCIKSRQRPICDVEVGARSVTVCHLGNLAYWSKRKLKWDPEKWEFPGDDEANKWRTRDRREGFALPTV